MSDFAILAGGRVVPTARLRAQLEGLRVIAADSGIRHAETLALDPELWVGDHDSSTPRDERRWRNVPRIDYSPEKDTTDSDLAIAEALQRGARSILLTGAFGGPRSDHAFLHMTQAMALAARQIRVRLTSGDEEGWPLLAGDFSADLQTGDRFSVLPFSDLAGLTIAGAKWPLDRRDVPFGSTLTLSNIVNGKLKIRLASGRAMVIAHPGAR